MIEMKVRGIAVDPGLKIPMVILTDDEEKRYLPIPIGVAEATAIFIQLQEQVIPRPMTHDLLKNIIDALGAKVAKVLVNDIHQNTFFARVFLDIPGSAEKTEIDARPSDAIALALRTGSPIFVAEKVVVNATIVDKEKYKEEMSEFKKFLENLSPKDFNFPGQT
ncbi:MAG TPA: bifunctional nuclease family protein [bacterium]|jgi:bifunctional DNase/RNase|nr:bifunctional nuclease family protein [bacterium]